jgi:polyisoprenoid-binding protein YceI
MHIVKIRAVPESREGLGMALFGRRGRQGESAVAVGPALPPLPPGAGRVQCRIVDVVALPMQADVELIDDEGHRVARGVSDPYGLFLASVPGGFYDVVVTADGYEQQRRRVQVFERSVSDLGEIMLDTSRPMPLPGRGRWDLDPAHSTIRLAARHLGLGTIHGRFNSFRGVLRVGDRMEDSLLDVTIDASSIDTGVKVRDDHLRSPDFLDVEVHPYLTFVSDRFTHRAGREWYIDGILTLHGVSRPVRLDTAYQGMGTGMQGELRAAARAVTELRREDFTLDWQKMLARGIAAIGSTIQVELDIQVVRND